jgi:hypothetical protein
MSQTPPDEPTTNADPQEPATDSPSDAAPAGPVRCPATKDTAVRMLIGAGVAVGFSVWCFIDWANYPRPDEPFSLETLNGYAGWAFNHFLPFILLPLSVVLVVLAFRSLKLVLVADDQGIGYEGKDRIAWSDVTRLDATKLADKQILDLYHAGGKLRLDGLKLQNFKKLVRFVEEKVPDDKQQIE